MLDPLTPDDVLRRACDTADVVRTGVDPGGWRRTEVQNNELLRDLARQLLDAREALRELLRWSEPTLQALNVLGAGESAPSRGGVWKIMKYAKSLLPEYGEADDEGGA